VERQPRLAQEAGRILERLGYSNITVVIGDGTNGVPQFAPYNAIIVAAAAPTVPPLLLEQLAEGGRLVIPIGSRAEQILQLVKKIQGNFIYQHLEAVRFVPLLGEKGFPERDF
jgi:protein-L-isoaspartate(D-aspartate) O-methyltransferase